MSFKIGDKVEVNTKCYGWKTGTIVGDWGEVHAAGFHWGKSWAIAIPNHWTKQTLALERDMRKAL